VRTAAAFILVLLLVVFCAMIAVVLLFALVRNLHRVYCWFRESATLKQQRKTVVWDRRLESGVRVREIYPMDIEDTPLSELFNKGKP
jgi:hypothetical protein